MACSRGLHIHEIWMWNEDLWSEMNHLLTLNKEKITSIISKMSVDTSWASTTAIFSYKQWAFSAGSTFLTLQGTGRTSFPFGIRCRDSLRLENLFLDTRNKAVSHCQWPARHTELHPALSSAEGSVLEHSHVTDAGSWLHFLPTGCMFAENTFPVLNTLFLGRL